MLIFQRSPGVHRVWRVLAIAGFTVWLVSASLWWTTQAAQSPSSRPVAMGFARDMSIHHNQAVNMALLGAVKGSPEIQSMALKIIRGQSLEMGMMQAWSMPSARGSGPNNAPMMGWMADRYARMRVHIPEYDKFILACQSNPHQMPGMASLQELQQLQQLAGREFNSQWLQLMIRHHEAATIMIQFASEHAETAQIRTLATSMLRDQVQESAYLISLVRRDGFMPKNPNNNAIAPNGAML